MSPTSYQTAPPRGGPDRLAPPSVRPSSEAGASERCGRPPTAGPAFPRPEVRGRGREQGGVKTEPPCRPTPPGASPSSTRARGTQVTPVARADELPHPAGTPPRPPSRIRRPPARLVRIPRTLGAQVEGPGQRGGVRRHRLVDPRGDQRYVSRSRQPRQPQPPSVGGDQPRRFHREGPRYQIRERHPVALAIATAHGRQPSAIVPLELDLDDIHRGADDAGLDREPTKVVKGLFEGRELFVFAVGVHQDLVDEVVEVVVHPDDRR